MPITLTSKLDPALRSWLGQVLSYGINEIFNFLGEISLKKFYSFMYGETVEEET